MFILLSIYKKTVFINPQIESATPPPSSGMDKTTRQNKNMEMGLGEVFSHRTGSKFKPTQYLAH